MTDTNNTAHPEITWELCELISNFESMMNLNCLESTSESDATKVAVMTHLYGHVLLEKFEELPDKIRMLENFYNENFWEYERNRKIDKPKLFELRDSGAKVEDIIKILNIGRSTYYKIIKEESENSI